MGREARGTWKSGQSLEASGSVRGVLWKGRTGWGGEGLPVRVTLDESGPPQGLSFPTCEMGLG